MAVVAARRGSLAGRRLRMTMRGPYCVVLTRSLLGIAFVALAALAFDAATTAPANAQAGVVFNPRPPKPPPPRVQKTNQMLVQAIELDYDYTNQRVSAVGNVQIFYNGQTLEADKVVYDQKTKRLAAEGNVRLTDIDGKITYANFLDLSDDYRDGFVDSLRVDTADQTRMAATRADRTNGEFTVFQSGVYTACAACKENPKKPPLWQVKGARIIHDQGEKMLYFEDARLEFFGVPLAYLPYFSTPDPTVKRKSGFLSPHFSSNSRNGVGVETPYFFALAPDYDLTVTPRFMTKQGVLVQGEFRQQLINGSYNIRAYGIQQLDKGAYVGTPGNRDFRGALDSKGQFSINDKWVWGWEGVLVTDTAFFRDYRLSVFKNQLNAFLVTPTEGISQAYLTGIGNRSFFDARVIHYLGYSASDVQSQIPVIHPVIDYNNVLNRNIFGGEISYRGNFTSLTRGSAAFEAISPLALATGACLPSSPDPTVKIPANCLLRGVAGTYTRLSGEVTWRRSYTDTAGQIWTPFASLRGDLVDASIKSDPGTTNFLPSGGTQVARVIPTIGLEYRYPFINVQPWGTTTVTPIAQVIVRPNESYIGRLPNEDAQSLVFDDSNLFSVNKFSGWDRAEGGGRANVGVQATTQFDRGGSINMLFGQSYSLFGRNSFATADITNTGINSGLETSRSDYVARLQYQPNRIFTFTTRARFDERNGDIRRFEAQAAASFDRWSVTAIYGNYDRQPELGFLNRREGVLASASFKINSNWLVSGSFRYDLNTNKINQYIIGAGYIDDCFVLGVNYITDYAYNIGTSIRTDHRVTLQIGLRTIGASTLSQSTSTSGGL